MRPPARLLWLASAAIAAAQPDLPRHARVAVQYIEVAPAELTAMMADGQPDGAKLHAKAMDLVRKRQAAIVETSMVVCRSGQKATLESIGEVIYPAEYQPPSPAWSLPAFPPTKPIRPPTFTAFETRNVGVTLEVEPVIDDNRIIDLWLVPQIVNWLRLDTWVPWHDEWGDASIRNPVFETWYHKTAVRVRDGKFECLGVVTPKPRQAPFLPRKILVFSRADVVTPVSSPP